MRDFDYVRSSDAEAALGRGGEKGARFIAGGTLLVDLLRLDVERPELLVDVTGLPFTQVEPSAQGVLIGALVSNTDLAYHALVREQFPALSEALLSGASPQLRNRATVGGNLLQRTRCAYFRDVGSAACNKRDPGSGCSALAGYSRMHAILGTSDACIAAHPSDMCVALALFDAEVRTRARNGERRIPLVDFHVLPGATPQVESRLQPGELVTHVWLPSSTFSRRSAYVKVRDRASYAFALASAAVALDLDGNTVRDARVALGGVGTKPWRSREVEQALKGQPATRETFQRVAEFATNGAKTTADNAFKVALVRRTLVRALERARDVK